MTDSALALAADPEIDGYSLAPAAVCWPFFDVVRVEKPAHGRGTPFGTDVFANHATARGGVARPVTWRIG